MRHTKLGWLSVATLLVFAAQACGEGDLDRDANAAGAGSSGAGSTGVGGVSGVGGGVSGAGGYSGPVVSFRDDFTPVDVHFGDVANAASHGASVSGGIPLARGALAAEDVAQLALTDGEGRRIEPFAASALGRWNDGSVKWLLLDFQATLPSGGAGVARLGLTDDAAPPDRPRVDVDTEAGRYVVDTGVLKAEINRAQFSVFDGVWFDRDGDGSYAEDERIVAAPGEMFVDLDQASPGGSDKGVYDYPASDHEGLEGGNWLRESKSTQATRYRASAGSYSVELFRDNASHVVFKLAGMHRDPSSKREFGKYSLYLHFYAGQSTVKATHTWIMTGDPEKNFVRRMAVELPMVTGAGVETAVGGAFEKEGAAKVHDPSQPPHVPLVPGESEVFTGEISASGSAGIVSLGPDRYHHNRKLGDRDPVGFSILRDGKEIASGHSAVGWADFRSQGLGVAVGVRDFWREHPKELRYQDGRVQLFVWPDSGGKVLDLRRRYPELRGTVKDGWGKAARREFVEPGSAVGTAKSTELFFHFHAGDHEQAEVDARFRRFQEPLMPFVDSKHNVASGVFGPLTPYDPKSNAQLENYYDLMLVRILRSQAEYGWTGMYDHGDYLFEFGKQDWELNIPANPKLFSNWGYAGWQQENYRFGQFAFVQYVRSGRYEYFRAAERWLRHARDVDCVYWDKPDDGPRPTDNGSGPRVGGGHRHDQQHWGAYLASYGIPSIAVVHHYYLTGEGRDLDAMRDNAEWLLGGGSFFENYGEYAALYIGEALGSQEVIQKALAHDEKPQSAFGRATYDSGMGLLLHDVHTDGAPAVRAKLRKWADLDEASAAFLRGYLEAVEGQGKYSARVKVDLATAFPETQITAATYQSWAARTPNNFRDAFSSDVMPEGIWSFPLRTLERMQADGPGGMGNDPGRHADQLGLMWSMVAAGAP